MSKLKRNSDIIAYGRNVVKHTVDSKNNVRKIEVIASDKALYGFYFTVIAVTLIMVNPDIALAAFERILEISGIERMSINDISKSIEQIANESIMQ